MALDAVIRNISTEYTLSVGGVVNSESLTAQATVIADAYAIDSTYIKYLTCKDTHDVISLDPFFEIFFTPSSTVLKVWAQSISPLSRGTLRINTTDPSADPVPDVQYLTIDADISVAIAAVRRISRIAVTPPFSDLITDTALSESNVPSLNATDEEVKDWLLST